LRERLGFRQFSDMVKIPVSGISLEWPDSDRVIKLTTPAPALTGVMANTTANSREGVTLPKCIDRLQVFTGSNVGNIFGDIDPYRAGMLAR
jgi:hypothetical protein